MTDVSYKHPAYNEFKDEWRLVSDCVDGEKKVKEAKIKYLPRPSGDDGKEEPERYHQYLDRAFFFNATGRTLMGLLGIAFSKPIITNAEGAFKEYLNDIDNEGQSITQFIRDGLSQNLQKGRAGILTDYTKTGTQTVAQQGRPILKLFKAEKIINWRVTNGKTSLIVLEYQEPQETDDYHLDMVTKWIELRLVAGVAVYKKWYKGENGNVLESTSELKDSTGKPLTELPWSWIGAANNDHTPDSPPLADIARANISHYRAEADIAESAHIVGQPMLVITGNVETFPPDDKKEVIRVGSRGGLSLPIGATASFLQVEDRNLPITLAERREKQMAALGAKLIERNGGVKTATQAGDEAQTDNSVLSLCAGNVEAAINRALQFAVMFAGQGEASIEINKRYVSNILDTQGLTALVASWQSGAIRQMDLIRSLQNMEVIDPTESAETVIQQLKDESPQLGGMGDYNPKQHNSDSVDD